MSASLFNPDFLRRRAEMEAEYASRYDFQPRRPCSLPDVEMPSRDYAAEFAAQAMKAARLDILDDVLATMGLRRGGGR